MSCGENSITSHKASQLSHFSFHQRIILGALWKLAMLEKRDLTTGKLNIKPSDRESMYLHLIYMWILGHILNIEQNTGEIKKVVDSILMTCPLLFGPRGPPGTPLLLCGWEKSGLTTTTLRSEIEIPEWRRSGWQKLAGFNRAHVCFSRQKRRFCKFSRQKHCSCKFWQNFLFFNNCDFSCLHSPSTSGTLLIIHCFGNGLIFFIESSPKAF